MLLNFRNKKKNKSYLNKTNYNNKNNNYFCKNNKNKKKNK